MSDEMREARDKWLRDKGYYSKNEMEPSVERAAKALRDAAREGFQAGAAWQAAQPVQVDDAEESVLKIFHDLFPWFTNEGGGPSSHDFVRAIRPYLSKQPVSVGEFREALRLLWFFLPEHEPANPHSNKAIDKEKNKRWHAACEIYQKYAGEL